MIFYQLEMDGKYISGFRAARQIAKRNVQKVNWSD